MKKLPSLQDVANVAGVSKMTVSLALRDHPRISTATRDRVKKAAAQVGYQPNPEVSQFMKAIRKKPTADGFPLAYVTTGETLRGWRDSPTEFAYWEGACERAASYGYYLEEYWLEMPRMSGRRLSDILWNRGIKGIIIPPIFRVLSQTNREMTLDLNWDRFCSVTIGDPLTSPRINRVLHDHYSSVLTAMSRLVDLGYRRIGLCLREHMDLTVNQRWQAGYRVFRTSHPVERIEPLIRPVLQAPVVKDWIHQNRLEAVLSADLRMPEIFEEMGIEMGTEIAYADLDLELEKPLYRNISGIVQNSTLLGMAAVDLLVTNLHRSQTGIPKVPFVTQIQGDWLERGSTPRRRDNEATTEGR
ncbi:MAG: LacI family transcriptional regulator [Puniceicoccaceae bacterium 5H]|nr:MAG: LacI family transcriptional regulator [Puniceicoccaceae bacterium 5H]